MTATVHRLPGDARMGARSKPPAKTSSESARRMPCPMPWVRLPHLDELGGPEQLGGDGPSLGSRERPPLPAPAASGATGRGRDRPHPR